MSEDVSKKETLTLKQRLKMVLNSEFVTVISESFAGIMIGTFFVQLILFLISATIGNPLILLHLLSFGVTIGAFAVFKSGAKPSHVKVGGIVLRTNPFLSISAIIIALIRTGVSRLSPEVAGSIVPFLLMMAVGFTVGYIILLNNSGLKDKLNAFETEFDITQLFGIDEAYTPGDMIIGKRFDIQYKDNGDKTYTDTDDDVILPVKDRYLHMLIIGPTGSGKTSQVLIPQINRDIKNKDIGLIVLEPKGDLAEQVFAMAEYYGRTDAEYFNPTHPDCPYFNPLSGPEDDVTENMTTTFKTLSKGSSTFFEDQGEMLMRRALSVLKRMEKDPKSREYLYGDEATLIDLSTLIHNNESKGRRMVTAFSKIPVSSDEMQKENDDIAAWFLSDYFTGSNSADTRGATKTYEHTSGIRNQVAKLVSNVHLRRVLNPPKGYSNDVDFPKSLDEGRILALTTNQGKLRDLGRFLGYFLILQLQSAIFKRPGNEDTRRGTMLFIDEFQVYANDGFEDMLTQGRSYRVACHLATQAIEQISAGGPDGKKFLAVVKTNCRNLIAFPDIDPNDAKWFSERFGETMVKTVQVGTSRQRLGLGNLGKHRLTNESIRTDERFQARMSPTDIMRRQFGEITFKIMKNNDAQPAGAARIEYIPYELKKKLDSIVESYNQEAKRKAIVQPEPVVADVAPEPQAEPSLTPVYDDVEPDDDGNPYVGFLDGDDDIIERGNFVEDSGGEEEAL